jgi:hypothetical protein
MKRDASAFPVLDRAWRAVDLVRGNAIERFFRRQVCPAGIAALAEPTACAKKARSLWPSGHER